MKNYVKREHSGTYVKSKIEINNSDEWTYLRLALVEYVKNTEDTIKFWEKCLYDSIEDTDKINKYKNSIKSNQEQKVLIEKMINDLDMKNEIKWI